jgi:very-short-patch-repair endonuclease
MGGLEYKRVEPDFVIYKDGIVMIVEIDGDLYHSETPAAAHARLKFLLDEGARLERITASECDTPEKAREAVARVIATIDKLRGFPRGMTNL